MSNLVKDTSYLFLTAVLRARESKMLSADKAERMLEAPSFEEAAKILEECGYEDMSGMKATEVEESLSRQRARVFYDVERMTPDVRLVEAFRLKYDYHNAKTFIKGEGAGTVPAGLLSKAGRVSPEKLEEILSEERYSSLPSALFGAAIAEARGVLARTSNPQLADFELDHAYFKELDTIAKAVGSPFLRGYATILADSVNLRSAVRTMRMGRGSEFLKNALIEGGSVGVERIASSLSAEGLQTLFSTGQLRDAAILGVQAISEGSLTAFERSCDNAVARYLANTKLVGFGESPVISYLAGIETEITNARMIMTGRLAGISADVIRERLREGYA